MTLSRVSGLEKSGEFKIRDTVETDTPTESATFCIVGASLAIQLITPH
jgi:hypothetical protein